MAYTWPSMYSCLISLCCSSSRHSSTFIYCGTRCAAMVEPPLLGRLQSYLLLTTSHFARGGVQGLWHVGLLIECSDRETYINAGQLYLISWSVCLVLPDFQRAAEDFDKLVFRVDEYVLLHSWACTVVAELPPSVVPLCTL